MLLLFILYIDLFLALLILSFATHILVFLACNLSPFSLAIYHLCQHHIITDSPYFSIGLVLPLILAGPLYYENCLFRALSLQFLHFRVVIWGKLHVVFRFITPTLTMYFFRITISAVFSGFRFHCLLPTKLFLHLLVLLCFQTHLCQVFCFNNHISIKHLLFYNFLLYFCTFAWVLFRIFTFWQVIHQTPTAKGSGPFSPFTAQVRILAKLVL